MRPGKTTVPSHYLAGPPYSEGKGQEPRGLHFDRHSIIHVRQTWRPMRHTAEAVSNQKSSNVIHGLQGGQILNIIECLDQVSIGSSHGQTPDGAMRSIRSLTKTCRETADRIIHTISKRQNPSEQLKLHERIS